MSKYDTTKSNSILVRIFIKKETMNTDISNHSSVYGNPLKEICLMSPCEGPLYFVITAWMVVIIVIVFLCVTVGLIVSMVFILKKKRSSTSINSGGNESKFLL